MSLTHRTLLAYLAVYIGWGTTYLAIKIGIESISPGSFLGIRFLIASIIFLPFVLIYFYRSRNLDLKEVSSQCLIGIGLLVFGLYPIAIAEKSIPSNITALMIGCAPIAFALFSSILNKSKITSKMLLSMPFGIIGIIILNIDTINSKEYTLYPVILIVFGILSWSFSSIYLKQRKNRYPTFINIYFQFLSASIILLFCGSNFEGYEFTSLNSTSLRSITALAYIIIIPTLISYFSYIWLLKVEPSERVSTYAYINPIVAILSAWWILGEKVNINIFAALIFILLSVYIVFHSKHPTFKKETYK